MFTKLLALVALVAVSAATANSINEWHTLDTALPENRRVIVSVHNEVRRGVTPTARNMLKMTYNSEAEANSRRWAANCVFEHSPAHARKWTTQLAEWGCGENLFMSSNPRSWDEAVRSWYNEVTSPGFQYGVGATSPGMVGHYTQVVWYKSHQVGCAVNYCPNNSGPLKYLYVCQYCPAGNLNTRINEPYDLGKACDACPNNCDNKLCTNPCLYSDKYSNCPELFSTYGCGASMAGQFVRANCKAQCQCTGEVQ